jgi:hypothetical protein
MRKEALNFACLRSILALRQPFPAYYNGLGYPERLELGLAASKSISTD